IFSGMIIDYLIYSCLLQCSSRDKASAIGNSALLIGSTFIFPGKLVMQGNNLADNYQGWGFDIVFLNNCRQGLKSTGIYFLLWSCSLLHQCNRCIFVSTVLNQFFTNQRQADQPHINNQSLFLLYQMLPVEITLIIFH